MLTWQPCTDAQVEETRLRRRIHRLEARLESFRSYHMGTLYNDAVAALEAELANLRDHGVGG